LNAGFGFLSIGLYVDIVINISCLDFRPLNEIPTVFVDLTRRRT